MKRRLIGPILISCALCALLADYLYSRDSYWSVVKVLTRIAAVFAAIFGPAFNPALYTWLDAIVVPVLVIVLVIVLMWMTVARAKSAMSKATPSADTLSRYARPAAKATIATAPAARPEQASQAVVTGSLRYGLVEKLSFSFGAVAGLFSVTVCMIVYGFLYRGIEKEIKSRADASAIGVHDIAARRLAAGGIRELQSDLDKLATNVAVAFIYVEDGEGKIVAHVPDDLPRYLRRNFPRSAERAVGGINVDYRGVGVYEIAKRVAGGEAGFVHFGIWHDAISEEARLALLPMAIWIFVVGVGASVLFIHFTRYVNRPILELVDHAKRVSKGDFVAAWGLMRADEIGEIACSLERMRSSLYATENRLQQGQLTRQSGK